MKPAQTVAQPVTDARHKSANPGEPYANAKPGEIDNDTLGAKGYHPPGGPGAVMKDQQKTKAELETQPPAPTGGEDDEAPNKPEGR